MQGDDIKKAPKTFCENIKVGFTPEYFVLGLGTGNQAQIYAMTPQHTKRLIQYLSHQVSEFEKEHGEIKAEWNPNVVSPIQRSKDSSDNEK